MKRSLKYFMYVFFFSLSVGTLNFSTDVHAVRWEDIDPAQKEVAFRAGGMSPKIARYVGEVISGIQSPCAAADIKDSQDIQRFLLAEDAEMSSLVRQARFSHVEEERILSSQRLKFDALMESYRKTIGLVSENDAIKAAVSGLRALFTLYGCPKDDASIQFTELTEALSPLVRAYETFKRQAEAQSVDAWVMRKEIFPRLEIPVTQGPQRPSLNSKVLESFERLTKTISDAMPHHQKMGEKKRGTGDEGVMDLGRAARLNFNQADFLLPELLGYHGMTMPMSFLDAEGTFQWFLDLKRRGALSLDGYDRGIRAGLQTIANHKYPFESAGNRLPSVEYFRALTILRDISERYGVSAGLQHRLEETFMAVFDQEGKCATGALGRAFITCYHGMSFLVEMPTLTSKSYRG